jgi:Host cell surface-exposed lipoprotein
MPGKIWRPRSKPVNCTRKSPPLRTSTAAPAAPQYTPEQQQAIEAAEQYLQMGSGFSRLGMVQQLESPYGNDFTPSQAAYGAKAVGL